MTNKNLFDRAKYLANHICGPNHPYIIQLFDERPMIDIDGESRICWSEETIIQGTQGYQVFAIDECNAEIEMGEPEIDFDMQFMKALHFVMLIKLDNLQINESYH